MKKFFIGIALLIGLFLAAAIILPMIYKDDIKALIDAELEKTLNATVVFDTDNFHMSLLKHFPDVTVGVENFGIINKAPFEGEILFAVKRFDVVVNLKKILIDEEMSIKGIYLDEPVINLLADKQGNVNWDIYIAPEDTVAEVDEEVPSPEESTEPMEFEIEKWEITNANFVFYDPTIPVNVEIKGMNHSGSGDFTLTLFDLSTHTFIENMLIVFDGTPYINNKEFELDAVLSMDLDSFKFTFKENEIRLNQFKLGFDGWFAMPEDGFDMDLTYFSTDNSFRSLLSLVPAVYMEGFEELKTSGNLSFGGNATGKYTETQMPSFNVFLDVTDGMFQYPDLPAAVSNVQLALKINNSDGIIDNTSINISKFHIEFGNNPFDATLAIANLKTYPINSTLKGKLNLDEMMTMFPMEGMELRGTLDIDIGINGVYDSIKAIIPKIDAKFTLTDGYASTSEVPIPLEDMQMNASIVNTTGKMKDIKIAVDPFKMKMQDESFVATLFIENMDDYTWDAKMEGTIDLNKLLPVINEFYPMPTTTMEGLITSNLRTSGKMSDLEAERYAKLPTSGSMQIEGFKYYDEEMLPQGFEIRSSNLTFDPKMVRLQKFEGSVGRTDLNMTGSIQNHIAYVFSDGTIKGNLAFNSKIVDLNEWMEEETPEGEETDESTDETTPTDTTALEVFPVPTNIDFTLTTKIDKIIYDNMVMSNARGAIIIRNGEVDMKDLGFDMLGGRIVMNGKYHTHDINKPYFNYDLDINAMSIQESYATFNTVQSMAPIAKNISGDYSTKFKIDGNLGKDMMPLMESINGAGLIKIAQATLSGSKIVTGINALTGQAKSDKMDIANIVMKGQIKDGRFFVEPFDVMVGKYPWNVSGSNSLDGSLDYKVKMEIPAGDLGKQLNQSIASLTGSTMPASSNIKFTIGIGGTYDDPKPKLLSADTGQEVKEVVKEKVKEKLVETIQEKTGTDIAEIPDKEEVKEEVKKEVETTKVEVKEIAKTQADSLKEGLIKGDTAQVEKAIEDATDKIKNLFNRKKKKKN